MVRRVAGERNACTLSKRSMYTCKYSAMIPNLVSDMIWSMTVVTFPENNNSISIMSNQLRIITVNEYRSQQTVLDRIGT